MSTPDSEESLVRTQNFPTSGPVEVDVSVTTGTVEIQLTEELTDSVVQLRHDSSAQPPWMEGVTNLLSWVGEQFGGPLGESAAPAEAVRQARVEQVGNRLVAHAPTGLPLRHVPLAVTVQVPAGSSVEVSAGAADVTLTGSAGRVDLSTGTGDVRLETATGSVAVRTGSGAVQLGDSQSGAKLRTGSGQIRAATLNGSATLVTGTGDVWLGTVSGDVLVRTGSGDLSIARAEGGSLELVSGSGQIRVGIGPGVAAEVELSSGSGKVSSELAVSGTAPGGEVPLSVRARTGSGDAVVTRSTR